MVVSDGGYAHTYSQNRPSLVGQFDRIHEVVICQVIDLLPGDQVHRTLTGTFNPLTVLLPWEVAEQLKPPQFTAKYEPDRQPNGWGVLLTATGYMVVAPDLWVAREKREEENG